MMIYLCTNSAETHWRHRDICQADDACVHCFAFTLYWLESCLCHPSLLLWCLTLVWWSNCSLGRWWTSVSAWCCWWMDVGIDTEWGAQFVLDAWCTLQQDRYLGDGWILQKRRGPQHQQRRMDCWKPPWLIHQVGPTSSSHGQYTTWVNAASATTAGYENPTNNTTNSPTHLPTQSPNTFHVYQFLHRRKWATTTIAGHVCT